MQDEGHRFDSDRLHQMRACTELVDGSGSNPDGPERGGGSSPPARTNWMAVAPEAPLRSSAEYGGDVQANRAGLAQQVEHLNRNQRVTGSIPVASTITPS